MDEQKFVKTVADFLDKVNKREAKVREHINRLERQINDIKSDIKAFTSNVVECELNDDIKGAKKAKDILKTLQTELNESTDMLEAYQNQLEVSTGYEKEIEKIKNATLGYQEYKSKKAKNLREEIEVFEQQIEELKQKKEQIESEIDSLTGYREYNQLSKLIRFIHPNGNKVKDYDKDVFIRAWLSDQDIERFFQ